MKLLEAVFMVPPFRKSRLLVLGVLLFAYLGRVPGAERNPDALADDFHSPRTDALGGAGHASPLLNDAIYLNPSFASFMQTYAFSFNYTPYYGGANEPGNGHQIHGHDLNASVQDGQSQLFQAGVGVTLRDDGTIVNVGASKAAIKNLGFGLGGVLYLPKAPNQSASQDMMFSSTFIATNWLNVAFIVDNMIADATERSRGFYRQFTLGTKVSVMGIMLLYLDPHLAPLVPNQPEFGYQSGVEFQPFSDLYLRFGMYHSSSVPFLYDMWGNGYGTGFGWISPKISFDFAIARLVQPTSAVNYDVGLTLYL